MALITCSECAGKLSDRAAKCPHCGCPVVASVQRLATTASQAPPLWPPPPRPAQNPPQQEQPATATARPRLPTSIPQPAVNAIQPPAGIPKPPRKSISWRFKLSACVFWFFAAAAAVDMLMGIEPFSRFITGAICFAIGMWQWNCAKKHSASSTPPLLRTQATQQGKEPPVPEHRSFRTPSASAASNSLAASSVTAPPGTQASDTEDHIADLTEAIHLDPQDVLAYYNRGVAYGNNGDWTKALTDFNEAIRLDPKNALAYFHRGWAHANNGEHDNAISDFSAIICLNSNYAKAFCSRGIVYKDKGDFEHAIADYTEAIRLTPKFADPYYFRGVAYEEKGDHDQAIIDFTEAIRLDPKNANAYYERGWAYGKKGERAKAEADLAEAKKLGHP